MSAFLAMSGFMSVFVFMSAANAAPPQPALINSADATPNPNPRIQLSNARITKNSRYDWSV
jgi:hypothetical protein